ncbi:hypothetical protein [Nakamurella multipartita]|uniref:hypothetical protein n=1 Tax=Nakamurella multipartita TaxID=53461 RepID=UPI0010FD2B93|nr:hypothetical protein [Nakamurella multipartita]HET9649193.1 hypothetical protein [Microlunatus sp.]
MTDALHTRRFDRALESLRGVPDPLLRLEAIRRSRKALDDLETATVIAARAQGASWRDIGAVYGLSKQGAQQRFRAAIPGG